MVFLSIFLKQLWKTTIQSIEELIKHHQLCSNLNEYGKTKPTHSLKIIGYTQLMLLCLRFRVFLFLRRQIKLCYK